MNDNAEIKAPRTYADVATKGGPDYYEYDDLSITWGSQERYEVTRRVGRGKYSEVFEAIDVSSSKKVVAKVLKPVKKKKIKREIKVLKLLRGGLNIIELIEAVRDSAKIPALIFEHVEAHNAKDLFPTLTDGDVRFYMFELLKALDFCHSRGIIHRDVKPLSIMIEHGERKLRLIDFGLAEFYVQGTGLNARVASRYYKGPELLVEYPFYDYSLDMWSFGCTFGGIILCKDPLFRGVDANDQLVQIARVLGTDGLMAWTDEYNILNPPVYNDVLSTFKRKSLARFVNSDNQRDISDAALDLLEKVLQWNHMSRLTAQEAMDHPYFADAQRQEEAAAKAEDQGESQRGAIEQR